jgi:hypothetical protein
MNAQQSKSSTSTETNVSMERLVSDTKDRLARLRQQLDGVFARKAEAEQEAAEVAPDALAGDRSAMERQDEAEKAHAESSVEIERLRKAITVMERRLETQQSAALRESLDGDRQQAEKLATRYTKACARLDKLAAQVGEALDELSEVERQSNALIMKYYQECLRRGLPHRKDTRLSRPDSYVAGVIDRAPEKRLGLAIETLTTLPPGTPSQQGERVAEEFRKQLGRMISSLAGEGEPESVTAAH